MNFKNWSSNCRELEKNRWLIFFFFQSLALNVLQFNETDKIRFLQGELDKSNEKIIAQMKEKDKLQAKLDKLPSNIILFWVLFQWKL